MKDHAKEVRYLLTDARRLCDALGLSHGAKPNTGGLLINCPAHGEKNPSCGITRGPDGTLRARCHSCGWTADALGIIGQAHGLSTSSAGDFREILAIGASIGGDIALEEEIRESSRRHGDPERQLTAMPERQPVPAPEPEPEREYPPVEEVQALWRSTLPCADDADAFELLRGRAIDPDAATSRGLARVFAPTDSLPPWATFRGSSWGKSGHRILVRVWDSTGHVRSLRAWQTDGIDGPKRLPPAGCKAHGLVLANGAAVRMLQDQAKPGRVLICEGEPDWMTWATRAAADVAVFGIGAGMWTQEHANKIPKGSEVLILTHRDPAGDKYAEQIRETLGERVAVWRVGEGTGDENDKAISGKLPADPREGCTPANELARKALEEQPRILSVRTILAESHKRATSTERVKRLTTGHHWADKMTGGIRMGHTWVIGAGSSWGKSSMGIAIADENIRAGYKVLIVSTEDDESIYGDRLMARRARVNAMRLRDRELTMDEHRRVCAVLAKSEDIPVYLDGRGVTFERLIHQIDRAIVEHDVDLVILDYIQECRTKQKHEDDRRMFREIARLFRTAVKLRHKAGIIMSQLTISDANKPPTKNDVRECKDMAHGAEVVALGWEPAQDMETAGGSVSAGSKVLIIDKAKDGQKGVVTLTWNTESACFTRVTAEEQAIEDLNDKFTEGLMN